MIEQQTIYSVALSNVYQYGTGMAIQDQNQVSIDLYWTKGLATSLDIIVQFSNDNGSWTTLQRCTDGSPTVCEDAVFQFTADGNKSIFWPVAHKYIRVGAKVNGTVTGSVLSARIIASKV